MFILRSVIPSCKLCIFELLFPVDAFHLCDIVERRPNKAQMRPSFLISLEQQLWCNQNWPNNPHWHTLNPLTPKLGGGVLLNFRLMDLFTENCYLNWLLTDGFSARTCNWKLDGSKLECTGDFNALFLFPADTIPPSWKHLTQKPQLREHLQLLPGTRRAGGWNAQLFRFVLRLIFHDGRWDRTVVTLPACFRVISEQTTLSRVCREFSSRRLRTGPENGGNRSITFCWQCKKLVMTHQNRDGPEVSCLHARMHVS